MVLLNPDSGRCDGIRKRQKIKNVDQYGKHASRLVERDSFYRVYPVSGSVLLQKGESLPSESEYAVYI